MHWRLLILSSLLLAAIRGPQPAQAIGSCSGNPKRSHIYERPNPKELRLKDNECMARAVVGSWCAWEPIETGHGVSACQKGLNIRWRRRLCNCPPSKPIDSPLTWCRQNKNFTSVARLLSNQSRMEALKPQVWDNPSNWLVVQPFSRPGAVTYSLLACIQLQDCFFNIGGGYSGKIAVSRLGKPCDDWFIHFADLKADGMAKKDIDNFFKTKPKNYCRNPTSELDHSYVRGIRLKPWCYITTSAGLGTWDYCDIPRCGSWHYHGAVFYPNSFDNEASLNLYRSYSNVKGDQYDLDMTGDVNAESCFATCRFKCQKFALMNLRFHNFQANIMRACQCFDEKLIPNPEADFMNRYIDNMTQASRLHFSRFFNNRDINKLEWKECLLFNSHFPCPFDTSSNEKFLAASTFEISLPQNCQQVYSTLKRSLEPMTVFGTMGNLRLELFIDNSNTSVVNVLYSSRSTQSRTYRLTTMCTHSTSSHKNCPKFDASSKLDSNSYFNNVVDNNYQWIIIDVGRLIRIALVQLAFVFNPSLGFIMPPSFLAAYDVLIRAAKLPIWMSEEAFRSSDGTRGYRTEYFSRASMAEQMLWWRCEDLKQDPHRLLYVYAECSPHQRTRWIMIRSNVRTDDLEMKYLMGYHWMRFYEPSQIDLMQVWVMELPIDKLNCMTMHHPPMGPQYADYWEDLYSFDGDGQPLNPPVFAQAHPSFTLPLTSHDSVHPDERFMQEEWDVEACGDWQIQRDTTIVGVPNKLKITITKNMDRGMGCYLRKEKIGTNNFRGCTRSVYFRVDNMTGEVIQYPDFGRSYDLAARLSNCQFVCAVSRECKAFEFLQNSYCRLYLISYSLDTMLAYENGTVLGRKTENMVASNPFTWNNPYHPYYRMLQDVLFESEFFL